MPNDIRLFKPGTYVVTMRRFPTQVITQKCLVMWTDGRDRVIIGFGKYDKKLDNFVFDRPIAREYDAPRISEAAFKAVCDLRCQGDRSMGKQKGELDPRKRRVRRGRVH